MSDEHTPTATDALRGWLIHAGFSTRRRDAALAALAVFDAALRGETSAELVTDLAAAWDEGFERGAQEQGTGQGLAVVDNPYRAAASPKEAAHE